ncbi:hypothetical protein [Bacillus thuringiensis]|uniref:hypothetical protein n=1 Tax=Bacillus thuringiensis TaxID=1428 RepID=UPI000BF65992|nr:hypothetical protein [Bacillus thuringiensis]PEV64189.1 hypothetical protein CN434_25610 [Bacillus thuringiensis]
MRNLNMYIINKLIMNGFEMTGHVNEDNYYFRKNDILVSYTTPHEGTEFNHMIRGEMNGKFDRWGEARYEELFDDKEKFDKILQELKELWIILED